nr:hypothetical protein [Vespula vulgaris Partiti-like virus 1]
MYSLPSKHGFSQRHNNDPTPSPFLSCEELTRFRRSPVTLQLIRDDLLRYGNNTKRPSCSMLDLAITHARRAFQLPDPEKMIHLNDIFNRSDLNIWKSSPGLPWKDLGYATKNDIRMDQQAINSIRLFWHRIKYGNKIELPDSCAFVRSHIVEYGEYKVRAVWGYPATVTFGEAVFALPLIEAYQKYSSPIAYGYETAVGGAARIIRESKGKYHYALDFKNFDKLVPSWLIRIAFDILTLNLNFAEYRDYGVADARRSYCMYERIIDYFINTRIRLCSGERFIKRSGVASGSYFTQLIDSVVNYILIMWAHLRLTGKTPKFVKVFGDDSIFSSDELFNLVHAQEVFDLVGMHLNMSKSVVSQNIHELTFLGYQLNHGFPSRPFDKWLTALMFPEQRDRAWDDVASRALGLLYACAGCDSKFDSLCRMIINLKPYDLCLSRGMMRMLTIIGVRDVCKTPPDVWTFWKRLGV